MFGCLPLAPLQCVSVSDTPRPLGLSKTNRPRGVRARGWVMLIYQTHRGEEILWASSTLWNSRYTTHLFRRGLSAAEPRETRWVLLHVGAGCVRRLLGGTRVRFLLLLHSCHFPAFLTSHGSVFDARSNFRPHQIREAFFSRTWGGGEKALRGCFNTRQCATGCALKPRQKLSGNQDPELVTTHKLQ